MSSLETFRAEFRAASNEELVRRAAPARSPAPALSAEAWLALTEEMERRGLTPPDDTLADLALEEYQQAPLPVAPPRVEPTGLVRYRKASLGRRFVALIVDSIVAFAPLVGAAALMVALLPSNSGGGIALGILLMIASVGWMFYYRLTKDGRPNGQSIGKSLVDLMVVDLETNQPCTRGKSTLRELVMLGLNALPLGFLVEPLFAVIDDRGRRVGDRAVNTQVIETAEYRPPATIR